MLKFTLILIAGLVTALPAIAQEEKPTYVQQVQKLFDQGNAQATKQFQKTYPKPVPPTIQSNSKMSGSGSQPPAYKPPVSQAESTTATVSTPQATLGTEKKEQSPQINIYVPQGSNTSSAPNPYR